ncbi:MAG: MATE family efflux transporter [Lentisphaeria bacterium]|nr:MATE family efflux transporter [Lentisphaeria bacterium]
MNAVLRGDPRHQVDMCRGPLLRKIVLFSIPLIFSGILQLLFNTVDLIVVGRFASYQALAAVGATSSLTHLLVNFCLGISIGANVAVARRLGARKKHETSLAVHTTIAFSLLCGLVAGGLGIAVARGILGVMRTPPDIIGMSVTYMRIYFAGMPIVMLYNFGSAVMHAMGDTKRPFYFLIIAGIANVLLNLFFVVVCHFDVGGVAAATVISQGIAALLILRVLLKTPGACRVKLRLLRIDRAVLSELLRIGVPAGIQRGCFSLANLWVQSSLNTFGSVVVAGNTAAIAWESIGTLLSSTFGQTLVSFVGQNHGGRQYARIRTSIKYCGMLSFFSTMAFAAALLAGARPALALFNTDPDVIAWGVARYWVIMPPLCICGFQECFASALRGLGHSLGPTLVMIFCICVLRIVWIMTVFRFWPSFTVLVMTFPVSWASAALFLGIYLRYALKKIPRENQSLPA